MCYHILEGLRGIVPRNDSLGDVEGMIDKSETQQRDEDMSWEEQARGWRMVAMRYKDLYLKYKRLLDDYDRMFEELT